MPIDIYGNIIAENLVLIKNIEDQDLMMAISLAKRCF
jgi:hypothetical protein